MITWNCLQRKQNGVVVKNRCWSYVYQHMLREIEADLNEQSINVQDHTEKSEWLWQRDGECRQAHNISA